MESNIDFKNHLVKGQIKQPENEKHEAVSEWLQQGGGEAEGRPDQAQQLHGGVSAQAEFRRQPKQRRRRLELRPQGPVAAVTQLLPRRQQALITVKTYSK